MSEENGVERDGLGRFGPGNKASVNRGPNRVSTKVKESLVSFLEGNIDNIQDSFDKLKPIEKLQFIANILPYVTPKLSAVQSEGQTNISGVIKVEWSEPHIPDTTDKSGDGELQGLQGGLPDNS